MRRIQRTLFAERLQVLCVEPRTKSTKTIELDVLPEWCEKRKYSTVQKEVAERGLVFLDILQRETVKIKCVISKNKFFEQSRKEKIK